MGAGAAGGLLCRLLAEAGLHVALLEAGPFYDQPHRQFDEDELRMRKIWWPEAQYRITGTAHRGRLTTGFGVGGGTLVWTGAAFRLFEDDFRVLSKDGEVAGASLVDWPLTYADMEPAYDAVEAHIGLAGVVTPWDAPGRRPPPQPAHGYHRHTTVLKSGFDRLGLRTSPGPVAIASQPLPNREACCACGFCIQGCRTGAMYGTAVAEIPYALATGRTDLRAESEALRIHTSDDGTRAEAVEYVDTSSGERHLQPARAVVVSNNVIETPRLLLNSATSAHPQGLANSSGSLGRNFMSHPGAYCWGVFEQDMNPWEGFVLNHLCCLDFAQTRPGQSYIRGFAMESMTGLPVGIATGFPPRLWGAEHKALMRRYRNLAGFFTICEGLPAAANRVTVEPERLDRWGMPQAHLHYDWHANDRKVLESAFAMSAKVLEAAGAREVLCQPAAQVHMMGSARMGEDAAISVTNKWGRTHDVPNLYIGGGSLFPTGSSVNPTLTILALAWRTAEAIVRDLAIPAEAT